MKERGQLVRAVHLGKLRKLADRLSALLPAWERWRLAGMGKRNSPAGCQRSQDKLDAACGAVHAVEIG